jgi:hypothetical protein
MEIETDDEDLLLPMKYGANAKDLAPRSRAGAGGHCPSDGKPPSRLMDRLKQLDAIIDTLTTDSDLTSLRTLTRVKSNPSTMEI